MDITVVLTRTTVFMAVYALVLGIPLLVALSFEPQLVQWLGSRWWVWLWLVCAALATVAHYVNLHFQERAENRLLWEQRRYQRTLLTASKGMSRIKDLERLLQLIVHMLTKEVRVQHAGVFLVEPEGGDFVLRAARERNVLAVGTKVLPHDAVVQLLVARRDVVVYEELLVRVNDMAPIAQQSSEGHTLQQAADWMRRFDISLVVPSFTEDRLLGFLVMGEKRSGHIFSTDDLDVFTTLANQAGLAIENAMYFEELKTNQAYLVQSEKLASLGQLASGMAHEIHNPLTIISGETQLFLELHKDPVTPVNMAEVRTLLQGIIGECNRAADITKRVLRFAKPAKEESGSVDMSALVRDTLALANYQVRMTRITIDNRIPDTLPPVRGNATQLQEVLLNLTINAAQAMGEHGSITFTAQIDDHQMHLRVADTGPGIAPNQLAKIFDPFFTTKYTGTGLGLFVTQRIIRAHGGTIEVESEVGKGTAFILHLPIHTAAPPPAPPARQAGTATPHTPYYTA